MTESEGAMGEHDQPWSEEKLLRDLVQGKEVDLGPNGTVNADIIRRIVLRIGSASADSPGITDVGIRIVGGRIEGLLDLDQATGPAGAPLFPLSFKGTIFAVGFSGRDAHFSYLNFNGCKFETRAAHDRASIELSGASIGSDLDLRCIRPADDTKTSVDAEDDYMDRTVWPAPDAEGAEQPQPDYCWVMLARSRIDGKVDLSGAHLRLPDPRLDQSDSDLPARHCSEGAPAALDLSLADVDGDLNLLNGCLIRGLVRCRSMHLKGDLWMTGAKLNGCGGKAISLQLATIDCGIHCDSRINAGEQVADRTISRFGAKGCLHLLGTEVGGDLLIGGALLEPDAPRRIGADNPCIDVQNARIHGQVKIVAAQVRTGLKPGDATVVPTIVDGDIRADSVDCGMNMDLCAQVHGAIDLEAAKIQGSLNLTGLRIGEPPVPLSEAQGSGAPSSGLAAEAEGPCGEAPAPPSEPSPVLSLKDATIGRALQLRGGGRIDAALRFPDGSLVDLSGASCDTLDDDIGRAWGPLVRIRMSNFTYRRTGGNAEAAPEAKATRKKRMVTDFLRGRRAEGRFPWILIPPWLFPERDDAFWEPWQHRRNWIYQQFDPHPKDAGSRWIARHRIDEDAYRPQSFEQAILVARAEGNRSAATNFEILKERIEWRLFNKRVRWPLAGAGVTIASLWLIVQQPSLALVLATLAALLFTLAMIIKIFAIWNVVLMLVERISGAEHRWVAKTLLFALIYMPAFLLYIHHWHQTPEERFTFFVAFLIFASIRGISSMAHFAMRFGFGYLRRPLYAITTFFLAFVFGWAGVVAAGSYDMLVLDTAANASFIDADGKPRLPVSPEKGAPVRCGDSIDAPLYALDILVPILDLREEGTCRIRDEGEVPVGPQAPSPQPLAWLDATVLRHTLEAPAFWAALKALYAIAGWFIVSLAILTFTNNQRRPGESG